MSEDMAEVLYAALLKYGHHIDNCPCGKAGAVCECGLLAILIKAMEARKT